MRSSIVSRVNKVHYLIVSKDRRKSISDGFIPLVYDNKQNHQVSILYGRWLSQCGQSNLSVPVSCAHANVKSIHLMTQNTRVQSIGRVPNSV